MTRTWAITSNDDDTVTLEVGSLVVRIEGPTYREANDAAHLFAKAYTSAKVVENVYRLSSMLKSELDDVSTLVDRVEKAVAKAARITHHIDEEIEGRREG